jgi:YhcH/YjgK/YiaL family protein
MIYGHIEATEQWDFLATHPVWKQAFDWLKSLSMESADGKFALRGDDMYGLVMRYQTVPTEEARFESHRQFVDLQYTLSGGEKIGWARSNTLKPNGDYDAAKDVQFYSFQPPLSLVHKTAGHFSIFHPSDAHMPKLSDGIHGEVFKAVVKIRRELLVPRP